MIINVIGVRGGEIEVKHVDFVDLIAALEPGNPDSSDRVFETKVEL